MLPGYVTQRQRSRNTGAPVVLQQRPRRQPSQRRWDGADRGRDLDVDRVGDGFQRQRRRSGQPVSRCDLFSQAADRMAALWVYPVAACLSSRLSRLAKTRRADFGGDMCPAGPGLDSIDRRGGQRGQTVAQAWADIPAARRDGEARGGVLCRGVSDEQGRTDQGIQGRISSPLLVVGLLSGLVLLQPDLGTVVVVGAVTLGLLFLGGARLLHLSGLIPMFLIAVGLLIWKSPYRLQRLLIFLDPTKDPTGAGFQVNQSFLAFGSGGPFGVGLGAGKQKLYFLPEAHTDFVLALVGEELGLVGTAAVMLLFAILIMKGLQIAGRAQDPFGRHLAYGITLLIGAQAMINASVATGLLPTKGLTLPLVSYGGSSLLVNLLAIGILLSISRDRQGGRRASDYGSRITTR